MKNLLGNKLHKNRICKNNVHHHCHFVAAKLHILIPDFGNYCVIRLFFLVETERIKEKCCLEFLCEFISC